ncbi:MAG: TIR domain-containing protein, partial [Pseudonocardiaceae bacterium]
MARVFISYAREDLTVASEAHRWLVEAGHEVFLDQDPRDGITVGEQWEQRLHEQLNRTDAMVCVVTTAYLTSTWCAAEVGIARSRGKQVLPLRAEPDVTHPLLNSIQHTDLAQDPARARAEVVEALQRLGDAWPADRSPFPGLRPFDVEWQRVFFGRADEVRQLAGLLRSPAQTAALLVVGPSGCGKSSLVRAGLVPMMGKESGWATLPPLVPGDNPVAMLARELATAARHSGLDWSVAHVRNQLDQGDLAGLADELLLTAPGGPQRRLLVVVDQFEELLTLTSQSERARFAELLRPVMSGPVQVVGALRTEFLDQLLLDRHLSVLPTQSFMLRPLRREALRAVIEQPAQLAGIKLDDGLVDRLVEDTDSGEGLPLLAFILAQLADGISRGGRISNARYDQLGGVQGGLARQADEALADAVAIAGRSPEQVISGLLRLVTVDELGHPTRWRIHRDELPEPMAAELNTFVARRLLTTDADNGTVTIGVAHEAFLSAWPPLAGAITANVSALRARRTIEHAAAEWHDNDRPRERLWSGGQLAAAVTDIAARIDTDSRARWRPWRHGVLVTDRGALSPTAGEFLYTSIRRDRFQRRRAVTVLSVLLAVALTGATVAVIQRGAAREQLHLAASRQLLAQAEVLLDSDPQTALRLGVAALGVSPSGESRSSLFNLLTSTLYAGSLTPDTNSVSSVAFSPVGNILATTNRDGAVSRWDVTDPTTPHQLGQPLDIDAKTTGLGPPIVFSPKEPILVTAGRSGPVKLWDLTDPTMPRQLGQSLDADSENLHLGRSVTFSPQGQIMAITDED